MNASPASKKLYIVCVDDDPIVLLSLRTTIKALLPENAEVLTASKGDQALHLIRSMASADQEVILLISDWRIPNLHGDDLFKIIHKEFPKIQLIMISGYPEREAKMHLKGIPHTYIVKPADEDQIGRLVLEAIKKAL